MNEPGEWLSPEEAAEWMGVPVDAVHEAVRLGQLPAIRLGGFVRLSRRAMLDAAAGGGRAAPSTADSPSPSAGQLQAHESDDSSDWSSEGSLPPPSGLRWIQELEPDAAFSYRWGDGIALYSEAWRGSVALQSLVLSVKLGRQLKDDHEYLAIWVDNKYICQFYSTPDGRGFAGLIKPDSKHTVSRSQPPPPPYDRATVHPYNVAVGKSGVGVPTGLALVIDHDDLKSATYHALYRWIAKRQMTR